MKTLPLMMNRRRFLSHSSLLATLGLASSCASRPRTAGAASPPGLPPPADFFQRYPAVTDFEPVVPMVRIASGRVIHRFFDTSPISPSGRYVGLFRLPNENRSPQPGETGEVVLVDLLQGTERTIAESRGWETQMGANVQWGNTDAELYYNDVDTATWRPFAVQHDVISGKTRRLEGTVFSVSPDGRHLASYNLVSSRLIQVGYGVVLPKDRTPRNQGPVDNDGIFITDVATGKVRLVASIRDIVEKAQPRLQIENPEQFEFYCFQVRWNPAGTRLLAFLRWSDPHNAQERVHARTGQRVRLLTLVTLKPDGSDIRVAISPELYARGGHHPMWASDSENITINLNLRDHGGLELAKVRYDGTGLHSIAPRGSGHPSMHRTLPFVITDAYLGESVTRGDGTAPLRLIDLRDRSEVVLAHVLLNPKTPKKLSLEFRIDAHPVWDRTGRYVVFNGVHDNTRSVFVADLGERLRRSVSA